MIAVFWKRGCWRIIAASSKPSSSGMHTSTSTTAISFFEQALAAPRVAELALIRFSPSSLEDRLVGQQLGRLVVDQQDVDPVDARRRGHHRRSYRCSHMRSADSSCSVLTGLAR